MTRLRERQDVLFVAALAMIVRAAENFWIHPPMSEIRSDMAGYVQRANALLQGNWAPDPRASFYPFGTHALVFALEWVFRGASSAAIGAAFALMGGLAVVFSMLAAKRLAPAHPAVPLAVGIALALEPAWVQLGSYVLSETPTALAMSLMAHFSLRLVDEGRTRDAVGLGVTTAIGATFRPQVLASLAFLAALALVRRGAFARVKRAAIVGVAVPLAIVLAFSSARMHYHTGRWGPMPTNGPFNFVFGRCHCTALSASKTSGSRFEPPSLKALYVYKQRHGFEPFPPLDPVLTPELKLDGELWDPKPAYALARKCVEESGYARQLGFAATHVILLWGYNIPWPTDGWVSVIGNVVQSIAVLPGLVLAMVLAFRRERARDQVLFALLLGLFATAALFFGEARMRAPYDGIVTTLAFTAYARAVAWLRERRPV